MFLLYKRDAHYIWRKALISMAERTDYVYRNPLFLKVNIIMGEMMDSTLVHIDKREPKGKPLTRSNCNI